MDSEVIQEVFQVEKEAQNIVENARKEAKENIHRVQLALERETHEKLALARKQRDQEIEKASTEAKEAREKFELSLQQNLTSDQELLQCAQHIAQKMIPILLHSDVGDAL